MEVNITMYSMSEIFTLTSYSYYIFATLLDHIKEV